MNRWKSIWEERSLPPHADSDPVLSTLLAADGFDSGFAAVTVEAWVAGVRRLAEQVGLAPGESVYDVGCGAGAWLQPLSQDGHPVAGLDLSPALIERARAIHPDGDFVVGEAIDLAPEPTYDLVVGGSSFLYFPSLDYAATTLRLMAGKSTRAVALLDLPDLETRDADLARRRDLAGGEAAYAARYAGLDQQYYDRGWIRDAMRSHGLVDVHVEQQSIAGYGNAPYRFNAWGFVADRARPAGGGR